MLALSSADIDAIERATLAAVAPESITEVDAWLLPSDSGTIARAHSAVPLCLAKARADTLDKIEQHYRSHGLPPKFRVSDHPLFGPISQALQHRGYRATRPTFVQVANTHDMLLTETLPVSVDDQPDEAWRTLFLGPGFDLIDGASRVRSLTRSPDNVYASLRENGQTVSGGAGSFSHGWTSVHGMRTDAAQRGRGLAGQVLSALARTALARGYERCFLQVEANNLAAQSLYQRKGFQTAWAYAYWVKA